MKKIAEKIRQLFRSIQREIVGESNRVVVDSFICIDGMAYAAKSTAPNPDNRLEFEYSKPVIEGDDSDIHRVRCLDSMIGKLSQSFNSAALEKKVNEHVADVAASLKRVSAYRQEGENKTPIDYLYYYDSAGEPVAKIKLGL